MIHKWFLEDAWNHEKLPKHARRLKIFTSALMRGFSPNLYHIECMEITCTVQTPPKRGETRKKSEQSEKKRECVTPQEQENFLLYHFSFIWNMCGQWNQLFEFAIMECLFLIAHLQIDCVGPYSCNPRISPWASFCRPQLVSSMKKLY